MITPSAPLAKWRNDALDVQPNRPTKNSPTQEKPGANEVGSVSSGNAVSATEYERTKEDLNARHLNKILQTGLTEGNMEMESSVDTLKIDTTMQTFFFNIKPEKAAEG